MYDEQDRTKKWTQHDEKEFHDVEDDFEKQFKIALDREIQNVNEEISETMKHIKGK